MNRDGSPETELERFMLRAGLGRFVLESGESADMSLTRAQVEALAESYPTPDYDPYHRALWEYVVYGVPDRGVVEP